MKSLSQWQSLSMSMANKCLLRRVWNGDEDCHQRQRQHQPQRQRHSNNNFLTTRGSITSTESSSKAIDYDLSEVRDNLKIVVVKNVNDFQGTARISLPTSHWERQKKCKLHVKLALPGWSLCSNTRFCLPGRHVKSSLSHFFSSFRRGHNGSANGAPP